ncbi:hypothetical protein POJ06DRAFT_263838 [Lipomyces tetrasporus]|uniref:Uncharacterized protein n=1 Tax=Lipomyces tetrasporus TaxID=54092 RepID=A0AAD7QJX0_9ASCO|nr:uncharacterized protein POJ06DRAFT_263838 [Lipomyces tetrasporus]KAJ8096553.1 hypothetical protein POJ06DRAFT_263838 [Lipomyces tetrasporus]
MHALQIFPFRQRGFGQRDAAYGEQGKSPGEMRRNTYVIIEGCVGITWILERCC